MRGLVALTLAATGCSLVYTSRPKPPPSPPACTTSLRWPIVDAAVMGAGIVGLGVTGVQYWKAEDDHDEERMDRLKLQAAGMLVWMVGWAISSNIGAFRVFACEKAHAERSR